MIFTQPRFIVFFLIAFTVHWMLRRNTPRKAWLLMCSYAFYAAWDWRFLSLVLISTVVDYIAGLGITQSRTQRGKRLFLAVSVVTNLGILGVFKYYNFFFDSAVDILNMIGLPAEPSTLRLILPLGISFFTFQTMSYSIDIYRGKLKPTRNLLDLAVFVGFFPQLVAGPIVRAAHFLPQLHTTRRFGAVAVRACLVMFLIGFVKKACISDSVSPFVDAYYAAPEQYTALSAWIATLLWAVQVYCDFSGYSDMAIASAGLLGYNIHANFDFPYFATSPGNYWQRWHISLSTWLRDYLYIPLGGNHGSRLATLRNLMLTGLLGGLWHGAAWHFVIWGGLHGMALVAQRMWSWSFRPKDKPGRLTVVICIILSFYWVCFTKVFFRAADMGDALVAARSYVLLQSDGTRQLSASWLWFLAALAVVHWINYTRRLSGWWDRIPAWLFALGYGALVPIVLAFMQPDAKPFVYFQF